MLHIMCRNKLRKQRKEIWLGSLTNTLIHTAIHNFSLQFSQILVFHITTDTDYLLTEKSTNDIDTKLKHNSLHIFIPSSLIVFFFLWLTESLITRPGSFWNTPYLTPRHPPSISILSQFFSWISQLGLLSHFTKLVVTHTSVHCQSL